MTQQDSIAGMATEARFEATHWTMASTGAGIRNLGSYAFAECGELRTVFVLGSVTNVGGFYWFQGCSNLTFAYFSGNAPPDTGTAFAAFSPTIVYYLPGITGWGSTFGNRPTMLWNPVAVAPAASGGQFGFTITGPANAVIVVEASTSFANPVWVPVSTNILTGGSSQFTDPQWTNYPSRYYRFSAQ